MIQKNMIANSNCEGGSKLLLNNSFYRVIKMKTSLELVMFYSAVKSLQEKYI